MLILPIVNKNRILNVQVTLKNAEKIKKRVSYPDAENCEVIVNGKKLSESIYNNSKDSTSLLNFVRYNTMNFPRNYIITTDKEKDSDFYDVYAVAPPPKRVNTGLDNLYNRVLTDMRKEVPNTNKGKYLSLDKMGLNNDFTDEKILKIQRIVREESDTSRWPLLFAKEGVSDLIEAVEFVHNFDCRVVKSTTIPESSLNDALKALEVINTKDSKSLRNYYDTALSNRDLYAKISYVSQLVYNRPLNLIMSDAQRQKYLVKQGYSDVA